MAATSARRRLLHGAAHFGLERAAQAQNASRAFIASLQKAMAYPVVVAAAIIPPGAPAAPNHEAFAIAAPMMNATAAKIVATVKPTKT